MAGYIGKVTAGGSTYKVGSTLYGTCSTGAGTAAKVVTCADFSELVEGVTIHVKFSYSNTASNATMNVNSKGAKNLCMYGTTRVGTTVGTSWQAGAVVSFTYDGTSWVMNDYIADTDTLNTAGSNNSASKLFLIGATSQANSGTTYSNSAVYATNGALTASKYNGLTLTAASTGFTIAGGTTSKTLTVGNSYTLGAACEKSVGSVSSGNTGLVTGGDVYTAIQAASAGSLVYGGTVNSNADLGTSYTAGTYWIVGTGGGTIAGQACEAGDMVIAHQDYSGTVANDVDIVQGNIDIISTSDIDTIVAA